MASRPVILVLSLFFMLFFAANEAASNHTGIIRLGSWLFPEGNHTSWSSSSGHFAFGFYPQGEGYAIGIWLVTQPNNIVVWTANRDNPPLPSNSTLSLTKKGISLLQGGEEDPEIITGVTKPVASASMLGSGNFVLYDEHAEVVWTSFSYPTDTLLGGQSLADTGKLFSSMSESDHSTGHFYLSMQKEGLIGAYSVNSSHGGEDNYWRSKYDNVFSFSTLSLSVEGSLCMNVELYSNTLCLFSSIDLGKKSQNTTTLIYRATLGEDGNFRLYAHQFEGNTTNSSVRLLWVAMDECQIKGFCGFNSYCSNITGKAVCECYPGFIPYKSRGNDTMFLECKQNNSRDHCESSTDEDSTVLYNMTFLKDIYLSDSPYLVVSMKMEACKKSCLEDYDCRAVLYTSGVCNKYRLPLMYGRRLQDASMVALLKTPSGNVTRPTPNHTVPSPMERKALVDDKKSLIMILYLTLGCVSFLGLVIVAYSFFTYKRQVYKYTMLSRSENLGFTEDYSLRSFSFDELVKSTGGFTEEVGRGSFGAVYRGTMIGSNRRIAVKRLEKFDEGEREFQAEITAISRTHHRNLVKLIGFCIDGSKKLLVYEYVSNGSLANLLFKSHMHLPWNERLKIALDVARGVLYLHEECQVGIIHCNIKPQNILMDEAWTAKISDFGLARLLKTEHSKTNTMDDQRSRYLAPEWQKDESMSVKVDVYSFGLVLLEISCRRSNIDINVSSPEEILLSSWVYQCFAARELNKLVADGEGEDVDWKILERMVKVGLWCVQDKPSLRPSMKNVILMLEGLKDIPVPPSPALLVKI